MAKHCTALHQSKNKLQGNVHLNSRNKRVAGKAANRGAALRGLMQRKKEKHAYSSCQRGASTLTTAISTHATIILSNYEYYIKLRTCRAGNTAPASRLATL